jgi:hypothetical protein
VEDRPSLWVVGAGAPQVLFPQANVICDSPDSRAINTSKIWKFLYDPRLTKTV